MKIVCFFSSDFYKSAIIFISPHSAFPFVALLIVFGFIVSVERERLTKFSDIFRCCFLNIL